MTLAPASKEAPPATATSTRNAERPAVTADDVRRLLGDPTNLRASYLLSEVVFRRPPPLRIGRHVPPRTG
jgi:hypothetical protein